MSERLFLLELKMELRELPNERIEEIIDEYNEYFHAAKNEGLTEGEIIDRLGGNAAILARSIIEKVHAEESGERTQTSGARTTFIFIGLILFNLIIVVGPFVALAGAGLSLLIVVAVCFISPLIVLLNFMLQGGHLFELMMSFVLFGGALFIYPAVKNGVEGFIRIVKSYILWNKRVIYEGKL